MTKTEIRNIVKVEKSNLRMQEVKAYSECVEDILLNSKLYSDATVIYPYLAYNTEIVTDKIIKKAWQDGKKVCVPKVLDKGYMEFYEIHSFDEIEIGYCNIPEPISSNFSDDKNVLLIMPGLAFDVNHNRIGYGGGFYDRYLERKRECNFLTVSLAYEFQIFNELETQEHDKKVDYIITKKGLM